MTGGALAADRVFDDVSGKPVLHTSISDSVFDRENTEQDP